MPLGDLTKVLTRGEIEQVSALWVMASRDNNPIMTYRTAAERLGICDHEDVRKIVQRWRELFRPEAQESDFKHWKEAELLPWCDAEPPHQNCPIWISKMGPEQRKQAVKNLKISDVFRSQFRLKRSDKPSDIETVEFGLQHVDKHREILLKRDEQARAYDAAWWTRISVVATILISALSLAATNLLSYNAARQANALKNSEISLRQAELDERIRDSRVRTENLQAERNANFIGTVFKAYGAALTTDLKTCVTFSGDLVTAFSKLERPFRELLEPEYDKVRSVCLNAIRNNGDLGDKQADIGDAVERLRQQIEARPAR